MRWGVAKSWPPAAAVSETDAHAMPRRRVDAGHEGEAFYRKAALQNVEFNMTAWLRADKARSNSAGSPTQPRRFTLTFR